MIQLRRMGISLGARSRLVAEKLGLRGFGRLRYGHDPGMGGQAILGLHFAASISSTIRVCLRSAAENARGPLFREIPAFLVKRETYRHGG